MRLLQDPAVKASIEARQQQLASQFEVTKKRIVAEFAKLAFANVDDFLEIQPNGNVRIDLTKADRPRRAALARVTIDEFEGKPGSGMRLRRTSIKLASKQHALDSLARHLGMFIDRSEITLVDNLAEDGSTHRAGLCTRGLRPYR